MPVVFIHGDLWINVQFTENGDKPLTNRENRGKTEVNKKTKIFDVLYISYFIT